MDKKDIWNIVYTVGKSLGFKNDTLYMMKRRNKVSANHHAAFVNKAKELGLELSHESFDVLSKPHIDPDTA